MNGHDVIVIGAGSVGVPTALALARAGLRTLVLDERASLGQGAHKAAIGGVRATHGDPAKIRVGRESLASFTSWQATHGDDIEWVTSGYVFVAYREHEERALLTLLREQRRHGLEIDWLDAEALSARVPDLLREGLQGGTYSPGDGHCSTLLVGQAMAAAAKRAGATFRFGERVHALLTDRGRVRAVRTDRHDHQAPVVINAAGAGAPAVARLAGDRVAVTAELHEAGITEPVAPFLGPLVVDVRPGHRSANVYCYQARTGQVIFCLTPEPPIYGEGLGESSDFLPLVAERLLRLLPRLQHVRVRRTWRGVYPMTPDGSPLVGWSQRLTGLLHAAGMCGQGLMLGPGVGALITRMVRDELGEGDRDTLRAWAPERAFVAQEALR
jgi:sarcosine oxidase, subunit beta